MKINSSNPLISVIMPAFNAERYIDQALQSIFSQNYQPLEIIVIDDGSTDATKEIIKANKDIVYIYQYHSGVGAARQKGLERATGELIAFLDSDDLWVKCKLQLQTKYLFEHDDIDIVSAKMRNFIEPSEYYPAEKINPKIMGDREGTLLGTLLIRKTAMDLIGGINPNLQFGEDFDWYVRMQQSKAKLKCLDEVLLLRRLHTKSLTYSNVTYDNKVAQKAIINVIALHRKMKQKLSD